MQSLKVYREIFSYIKNFLTWRDMQPIQQFNLLIHFSIIHNICKIKGERETEQRQTGQIQVSGRRLSAERTQ